jgi:hypothetical protein
MTKGKRILSIKTIQSYDSDPDTSYMGEYSETRTSEFSIDRRHSQDCPINSHSNDAAIEQLERAIAYLNIERAEAGNDPNNIYWQDIDEAQDALIGLQDELRGCDCGGNHLSSGEYRYFNPSFNYVDSQGELIEGNTPEEVRAYVAQDYARMQALNNGEWSYIGISVEATVQLTASGPIQKISSGGLWGIESDSDREYLASIRKEESAQLREQLHEMGFSKRAISAAFRNMTEAND